MNCPVVDRRVRLGAATPVQRLLDDAALARALPGMPRCAVWFADDQIRAQATIGGNIVNASPAADATPCLIAHEARSNWHPRKTARSPSARMPLQRFRHGPRQDRARRTANCSRLSNATRCRPMAAASRRSAIAARW